MKTLLIISVLFVISCRPIQITVQCPHQDYPIGLQWTFPEIEQPEGGYIYFDGEKISLDSILPLDSHFPLDGTLPSDYTIFELTPH